MRKFPLICLLVALVLFACSRQIPTQNDHSLLSRKPKIEIFDATDAKQPVPEDTTEQPTLPDENKADWEEPMKQEEKLVLNVNGNELNVSWENNSTVGELIAYVQKESIVVEATRYGGFEQVGSLPRPFSRNDVQITTKPGDIVLYSGNQLVMFFDSNTWSYTRLGHIEGLSEQELSELLGAASVTIEIKSHAVP